MFPAQAGMGQTRRTRSCTAVSRVNGNGPAVYRILGCPRHKRGWTGLPQPPLSGDNPGEIGDGPSQFGHLHCGLYPADAGMNRLPKQKPRYCSDVPRVNGDRPRNLRLEADDGSLSNQGLPKIAYRVALYGFVSPAMRGCTSQNSHQAASIMPRIRGDGPR